MSKAVEKIAKQSQDAVSMVRSTISRLTTLNKQIEVEVNANEQQIVKLSVDNASMDELKRSNENIIKNFTNLLG